MKRVIACLFAGVLFFNFANSALALEVISVTAPPINILVPCVTPPSGLVGWWRGESNTLDAIGGGNGALSATGATYTAGEVGTGFRFDGTNGYVQIPDSAALKPTNVTVEAWVWLDPNVSSPSDGEYIIFKRNTNISLFEGYSLAKFLNHFQFVVSSGGNQVIATSTTVVQRGVWYHVAGSYDGNTLQIYVNGVAEASAVAGFALDYDTLPVFIGTSGEPSPNQGFLAGIVDEASIYKRALTPGEIAAIYHASSAGKCFTPSECMPPPAGLVGWWPGEGNTLDVINGDNGTLSSTGASYASGIVGTGFRFDGTSGYLSIPDTAALKPANVTLEAWVWLDPNSTGGPGGEEIIFKKNSQDSVFEGYSLIKQTVNSDNGLVDRFEAVVANSGSQVVINSTTIAQRGTWYHVACTYDGNTLTLFVNGAAEASTVAGFALDYGTKPVYVGSTGEPAPYSAFFAGIIDEPSIYNRALATGEIAAIYHAGDAGKCPGTAGPYPPYIITPPASQSAEEGNEVDLSVVAGGTGPFSYQWLFKSKAIAGATADTLSLANIHPSQAGNYKVIVSATSGSVTSAPAIVTVSAQNILLYSYTGSEKITTLGREVSYGYSGQMIMLPDTASATFIGWDNINGKKLYWISPSTGYLLFSIKGSLNHTYTIFGLAGTSSGGTQPNGSGASPNAHYLWSFLHRGLNANLAIATGRTYSFPNTFAFSSTQIYPDNATTNFILTEASSNYSFQQGNTKTANDTGQTVADLVSAQVKSLVKQGYQLQQ